MIAAIQSIPSLFNSDLSANHLLSLDQTDISRLVSSTVQVFSAPALFKQIVNIIWELCLRAVPGADELRSMAFGPGSRDLEQTRILARVNLALCSLVWDIVIGIWRLGRENEMLRKMLRDGGETVPADIALSPRVDSGSMTSPTRGTRRRQQSSPSESEAEQMDRLERKRGGSPPRRTRPLKARSNAASVSHRVAKAEVTEKATLGGGPSSISPGPKRQRGTTTERRPQGERPTSSADHSEEVVDPHSADKRPIIANGGNVDEADTSPTGELQQDYNPKARKRTPRRSRSASQISRSYESSGPDIEEMSGVQSKHLRSEDEDGVDREDIGVFARAVLNPVMFGVLAMMVYVWWKRDPPEPSVVVL
jgi:hypothetical protein